MSRRRLTRAQRVLVALHGTPDEFAERAMRAVGDMITPDEAIAALRKYRAEFEAAGENTKENGNSNPHADPEPIDQNRG